MSSQLGRTLAPLIGERPEGERAPKLIGAPGLTTSDRTVPIPGTGKQSLERCLVFSQFGYVDPYTGLVGGESNV